MLSALLAGVAAVGAFQTASSFSFSGSWNTNGATISAISLSSDGSCNQGSSGYYFQMVNHTFATAGVRTINSFGIGFIGITNASHQIDLSNLCNHSSVLPLVRGSQTNSRSAWAHWFEADVLYTFTLGSSSSDYFGAEFWDGTQGQTAFSTTMNHTWLPLTSDSSRACSQSSDLSLFDNQVLSVNASGYYNVFLGFSQNLAIENTQPLGDVSVTVLRGAVSATDLSSATCSSVTFVDASDSYDLTTQLLSVFLEANQNYTFVATGGYISGDSSYYGHYSLTVTPAHRSKFSTVLTFNPPDRNTCQSGQSCIASTSWNPPSALPYGIVSFQVPANGFFYIEATQYQDVNGFSASNRDLAFFLYSGANAAAFTCGGLASTCVQYSDSFDGVVKSAGSASDWTMISQAWYDTATYGSNASMDVYIIAGPSLNPNTQTSAPTATTSAAPTTASVSAAPTTASGSRAPTTASGSRAPTTASVSAAPTTSSVSAAPTASNSNSTTAAPTSSNNNVNSSPLLNPSFVSLCALVGFLWL